MATHKQTARKFSSIGKLEIRTGLEGLTPARIVTLYRRAPILRPVSSAEAVWTMFERSSHVFTAWHEGELVGIARLISDGVLYTYLCDLAVEPDVQGLGVGRQLMKTVMEACKGTDLVLRDSDLSAGFYERLGFKRVSNAWIKGR
ncbi:MAG: N-acetyltransferase [Bacteroidetes bacterium]|jgi:GNAT superfamily N-acetyltransferase|nr:N-acetyltransferase [Bacteroidota bacterium]